MGEWGGRGPDPIRPHPPTPTRITLHQRASSCLPEALLAVRTSRLPGHHRTAARWPHRRSTATSRTASPLPNGIRYWRCGHVSWNLRISRANVQFLMETPRRILSRLRDRGSRVVWCVRTNSLATTTHEAHAPTSTAADRRPEGRPPGDDGAVQRGGHVRRAGSDSRPGSSGRSPCTSSPTGRSASGSGCRARWRCGPSPRRSSASSGTRRSAPPSSPGRRSAMTSGS